MGRCIVNMDVVCLVWATTLSQFNTRKGDTMKNVTMFCALVLVLVLGMDSVNAGEPPFEELKPEQVKSEKPKTYWQEILETRRVFGNASEGLTGKEQQNLLKLCQASREAGLINYACGSFHDTMILRVCWPGPFYSKEGGRDGQIMCQMIDTRAYFAHLDAVKAFQAAWRRTKKNVQDRIVNAVCDSLPDGSYKVFGWQVERYHRNKTDLPRLEIFLDYIMNFREGSQPGNDGGNARAWKAVFARLAKPGEFWSYGPRLGMATQGGGLPIGQDGNGVSKDWTMSGETMTANAFKFLQSQEDQIWQDILSPSKELQKGLPRHMYWKRDADTGEPALVFNMLTSKDGCGWGSNGPVVMNYWIPNSLLKGLCPEWRSELDSFEKSLSRNDVSQSLVDTWHCRDSYNPETPAESAWYRQMQKAEEDLYRKYFAIERLRWHRITAIEYGELKAKQESWLNSHKSPEFLVKLRICATFSAQMRWDDGDGRAGGTIEQLEGSASQRFALTGVISVFKPR